MNDFTSYNDFLKVSAEIELNEAINELEVTMLVNDLQIDRYDEETCCNKVYELLNHIYKLQDISNRAMAINAIDVYAKSQENIIYAEHQMEQLRNKYMFKK